MMGRIVVDKVAIRAALAEFIASLFFVVFGAGSVCALGESPGLLPLIQCAAQLFRIATLTPYFSIMWPHLPPLPPILYNVAGVATAVVLAWTTRGARGIARSSASARGGVKGAGNNQKQQQPKPGSPVQRGRDGDSLQATGVHTGEWWSPAAM